MTKFVSKALSKIDFLDQDQVIRLITQIDSDTEMLRAVLNAMRDGVILCRADHTVAFLNDACRRVVPLYFSGDEDEGVRLEDLIDSREVLAYVADMLDGKERDGGGEFDFSWGDTVKTVDVSVVQHSGLKDGAFLVIFTDVTDKNRQTAALHQAEYLASMTTMAASVAHEIKNPLGAMKLYVDRLVRLSKKKGSVTSADIKKSTDVLEEEIDRLNAIVVEYLFAVRPMNVVLREGNLESLIDKVIAFVTPEAAKAKVEISRSYTSSVNRLDIDAEKIKQVLINLIRNALDAMPQGGKISITTILDGDTVLVKVADTGCGIPQDKLSKVFEPYFTTKGAKGTGLGLTIVYKIMKEHHGDVTVESKVGEGTTFTLLFPVPAAQRLGLGSSEIAGRGVEVKE